jgi:hypothetical protein
MEDAVIVHHSSDHQLHRHLINSLVIALAPPSSGCRPYHIQRSSSFVAVALLACANITSLHLAILPRVPAILQPCIVDGEWI